MPSASLRSILSGCSHATASHSLKEYGRGDGEFTLILIRNSKCRATLALQGAQLLEFHPVAGSAMLWLSPHAHFNRGKAVRGGIPLCLPWFGPHGSDPGKPQHGFARNRDWQLVSAEAIGDGATRLRLVLERFRRVPHEDFPYRFVAELTLTLSDRIAIELKVEHCEERAMPLSWALHSYHPVAVHAAVRVEGLVELTYKDSTRKGESRVQHGMLEFEGELDRVYLDVPDVQLIHSNPKLRVSSANCNSAILWNPGEELAARMPDVGPGGHRGFICLEKGNAADNTLTLAPGEVHRATVEVCSV
jgi:glucose-6-phosphate 1-epimerase